MKKGFTIVEMICSIALILVLTLIVLQNFSKISEQNKQSIYESKIDLALSEAINYGNDNLDLLSNTCSHQITIDTLISKGYLEGEKNNKLIDPRTNESMNNIIICVTYNGTKINAYLKED